MLLRNFLETKMQDKNLRPVDLARRLKTTKQSVSYALARNINECSARTIVRYLDAVGIRCDFKKLLS